MNAARGTRRPRGRGGLRPRTSGKGRGGSRKTGCPPRLLAFFVLPIVLVMVAVMWL